MVSTLQGSVTPRPLLIYDGDCSFCKFWVGYWKSVTGDRIAYAPYQEVAAQFPEIPVENFRTAAHFVDAHGNVSRGAEAMFRSLASSPDRRWPLWCYLHLPGLRVVADKAYEGVARHRGALYRLTRLFWGERLERARYRVTRSLVLRLLGIVYLAAFASWLPQVRGLIGSNGIQPANEMLADLFQQLGARAYLAIPTLAWIRPTDRFIEMLAGAGIAFSIPVILNVAAGPCLLALWALYLSQVSIGREFMAFQWDILLLEAGFLAVFFAPWRLRSARSASPSLTMVWLFRWLVFRVFLLSGFVKLDSRDESWRNLTAMSYHYETQPLPNPVAWYMHQLPLWFQKFSTAFVLGLELFVPFLIFAPRRIRHVGAAALIGLQWLILLTGNYSFFNWLTIALCLTLFDDEFFLSLLPRAIRLRVQGRMEAGTHAAPRVVWRRSAIACMAMVLVPLSLYQVALRFGWHIPSMVGSILEPVAVPLQPFYITNTYGLFAVMTTTRAEIVLEGSDDDEHWATYEFKYKPGELAKPPSWVAPFQPRLDWQMWFAALGNTRNNPWFVNLAVRLLDGSPEVLSLLGKNPFPDHPPRYIRAQIYDYKFTSWQEMKESGNWWKREPLGSYLPAVILK